MLDVAREGEKPQPLKLANPEILWQSPELTIGNEGCLSLPEHYAEVTRPAKIRLRYLDYQNEIREIEASGLLAMCLQHEIDHLDGVLFVDHHPSLKRGMILRKLAKAKRSRSFDCRLSPERGEAMRHPSAPRQALDLVFMGTPAFAATILARSCWRRAPCPRGLYATAAPGRPRASAATLPGSLLAAEQHGFPCADPLTLRRREEQARSSVRSAPMSAVVAAYGLILPCRVLAAPRLGCLNVHASLLPRWRGAAPIQRALLAGDRETGITIMQMEEGLDTGPILLQEELPIGRDATAAGLSAELAMLGGRLMLAALDGVAARPARCHAAAAGGGHLCRQRSAATKAGSIGGSVGRAGAPGSRS